MRLLNLKNSTKTVLLLVVLSLVFVAIVWSIKHQPTDQISEGERPIKIGFLTALTGLEAILGETQLNSFKLAVEHINASGGVGGRRIEYVVEDNQTTTRGTVEKARKLIYVDKVDVIIGLITSLEHVAARTVTRPASVPLFYTTYYEGGISEDYFVATGQVPNQSIDPTVRWLVENVGKTVYVLGSDYIWPRESLKFIASAFKENGGEVIGSEFFPFGVQDLAPALNRVRKAKPDMVWTMFAGADAVTALKQYRSFDMRPQIVTHGLDDIYSSAHPDLMAGVICNQSYFMSLPTEANKRFLDAYKEAFGEDKPVNSIGEATYTATWLYALAVKEAGTTEAEKMLEALKVVSFEAPQGTARIDPSNFHLRAHSILAMAKEDGTWEILENFGPIKPQF